MSWTVTRFALATSFPSAFSLRPTEQRIDSGNMAAAAGMKGNGANVVYVGCFIDSGADCGVIAAVVVRLLHMAKYSRDVANQRNEISQWRRRVVAASVCCDVESDRSTTPNCLHRRRRRRSIASVVRLPNRRRRWRREMSCFSGPIRRVHTTDPREAGRAIIFCNCRRVRVVESAPNSDEQRQQRRRSGAAGGGFAALC